MTMIKLRPVLTASRFLGAIVRLDLGETLFVQTDYPSIDLSVDELKEQDREECRLSLNNKSNATVLLMNF